MVVRCNRCKRKKTWPASYLTFDSLVNVSEVRKCWVRWWRRFLNCQFFSEHSKSQTWGSNGRHVICGLSGKKLLVVFTQHLFEFVCMASIWFLFGGWTMPCLFLVYHLFHKCDILCPNFFLIATNSSISSCCPSTKCFNHFILRALVLHCIICTFMQ